MPVTAKLSKRFYERLGDEIANELVDWFNQVDATYKSDLRELNEMNFARFDAKLEQRLAELRAELRTEIAQVRGDMRALDAKIDASVSALNATIERSLNKQTRFFFGAWAVLLVAIIALRFH
jgi:hypothetical protein